MTKRGEKRAERAAQKAARQRWREQAERDRLYGNLARLDRDSAGKPQHWRPVSGMPEIETNGRGAVRVIGTGTKP